MATLEVRRNKTTSYRVAWRESGERCWDTFASEKDARAFQRDVERHGNHWPVGYTKGFGYSPAVDTPPGVITFAEFAEATITTRAKANERTRADYRRDLRLHLVPTFGDTPLDQITREQVGQWLIALSRTKSPKSVKNIHGLASSIMADAVDDGLISRNVFKGAAGRLPAVKSEEMCFLSRQELDTIVRAMGEEIVVERTAEGQEPKLVRLSARANYRALTLFMALTGLRWSEATALTVGDIQVMPKARVTVTKAWKRQPDNTMELGEPKSTRSRRTISLPQEALDVVMERITGHAAQERLFVSDMGHTVHHGQFTNRVWKPAIEKAAFAYGLTKRPRIHDLRHSHASWLIAEGVDMVSVQRRLGHESIQTTVDRYTHLATESDDRINAALDRNASKRENESPASAGISA